ncbi:MAG: hypothetical protein H6625_05240 [Bdellovibrionaceae bacterium]|nr:hypothetical protein [Pseudobdellovibrionaceae bacterium]
MSEKYKSLNSKLKNKPLIIVTLIAFALVVFLAQISISLKDMGAREPASLNSNAKLKYLNKLTVHQKIKPPISITIEKDIIGRVFAGDEFEIVANVISEIDTENVKVEWSLPTFVEVVSGETYHSFQYLKKGEPKQVRLTLKSHSEENQQIHITASAPYGKQILSSVDQFNTLLEQDLKEAKAALVERNRNYIGQ